VDEGEGPPLLLLHGWPDFSILYRDITRSSRGIHRVVVPDLPGFGASSKPVDRQYSLRALRERPRRPGRAAGLDDLGLVVHDLGGRSASTGRCTARSGVSRLAILNTLCIPSSTRASSSSSRR
jgi:pimeloyl-ACP methyl ester carboxylesterase